MSIQWHITTDCQNRCKHCYVFDPATYDRERTCRLSLEDKLKVIDQIDSFGKKWGFRFPVVALMGGDPLLARTGIPSPRRSGSGARCCPSAAIRRR